MSIAYGNEHLMEVDYADDRISGIMNIIEWNVVDTDAFWT